MRRVLQKGCVALMAGGSSTDRWHPFRRVVATRAVTSDSPANDQWIACHQVVAAVAPISGAVFPETRRMRLRPLAPHAPRPGVACCDRWRASRRWLALFAVIT